MLTLGLCDEHSGRCLANLLPTLFVEVSAWMGEALSCRQCGSDHRLPVHEREGYRPRQLSHFLAPDHNLQAEWEVLGSCCTHTAYWTWKMPTGLDLLQLLTPGIGILSPGLSRLL